MIEIVMQNAQISIGSGPNGIKLLQVVDPQAHIAVTLPLDPESARKVGTQLASSLLVATGPLNGGAKQP
jgi:hypothetical protein